MDVSKLLPKERRLISRLEDNYPPLDFIPKTHGNKRFFLWLAKEKGLRSFFHPIETCSAEQNDGTIEGVRLAWDNWSVVYSRMVIQTLKSDGEGFVRTYYCAVSRRVLARVTEHSSRKYLFNNGATIRCVVNGELSVVPQGEYDACIILGKKSVLTNVSGDRFIDPLYPDVAMPPDYALAHYSGVLPNGKPRLDFDKDDMDNAVLFAGVKTTIKKRVLNKQYAEFLLKTYQ